MLNTYLRKIRRMLFAPVAIVAAIMVSACGADNDTADKVEEFTERTEHLVERDLELVEEYDAIQTQINEILAQSESGKPVIESGLLGQLADNMDQALALTTQYQQELERLYGELDKESPCYQPELAQNLKQEIARKKQVAANLRKLDGAQMEENQAIMAVLGATTQSFAAGVSSLMGMFKICTVPAALGMTKSELEARAAEKENGEKKDPEKQGEKPKLKKKQHTKEYHISPLGSKPIDYYLPDRAEAMGQIKELEISNGVTVDENLELVFPQEIQEDPTKAFTFEISGTFYGKYREYDIDVTVHRQGYTPLDSVSFSSPEFAECLQKIAEYKEISYLEEMDYFNCNQEEQYDLPVSDIARLKNAETGTIFNANITGLSREPLPPKLKSMEIYDSTLDSLPIFADRESLLNITGSTIKSWPDPAKLNLTSLAIDKETADCEMIRSWGQQERIFVVHPGLSTEQSLQAYKEMEAAGEYLMINTDCAL